MTKRDEQMLNMLDSRRKEREKARHYGLRIAAYLRRSFPGSKAVREKWVLDPKGPPDTHMASVALATALSRCARPDDQLLSEWVSEKFWGLEIEKIMPDIKKLYKALVKRKHTTRNKFVFNDSDNQVWYEAHPKKKVIGFDSQGRVKVMIWEDRDAFWEHLHFRRVSPRVLIRYECKYLERVSLKWFRDNDFKPEYGDCRDVGYMFSYERIGCRSGSVDRACDHGADLWLFGFEVNSALTALEIEEEK